MGDDVARRRPPLLAIAAVLVMVMMSVQLWERATGEVLPRCQGFSQSSQDRLAADAGPLDGPRVLVVGDSYSVGLGLDRPEESWPLRLAERLGARVRVAGFSGSGFSAQASPCGRVSFADRARRVVGGSGAELVVVAGGLNDVDQSDAAVASGLSRLLRTLEGRRVVVVGPVAAPVRELRAVETDGLLARLAEQHGVDYVSMIDLDLPYLDDRLHLTATGHHAFGDAVADALATG